MKQIMKEPSNLVLKELKFVYCDNDVDIKSSKVEDFIKYGRAFFDDESNDTVEKRDLEDWEGEVIIEFKKLLEIDLYPAFLTEDFGTEDYTSMCYLLVKDGLIMGLRSVDLVDGMIQGAKLACTKVVGLLDNMIQEAKLNCSKIEEKIASFKM